jgi:hypothetical protein
MGLPLLVMGLPLLVMGLPLLVMGLPLLVREFIVPDPQDAAVIQSYFDHRD